MSNTYGIYNSGTVVLEYWNGAIGSGELFEHQGLQDTDNNIASNAIKIVDFRDVQLDLTDHEVIQFAQAFASDCSKQPMALVIKDREWDRASLYAQQLWKDKREVIAFHTMEAACAWFDLDASNIESRIKELKKELLALSLE